jgi:antitoxin ParD1/3/4
MATRASLSITEPNEKWIQDQIDSKEFSSRSEVVNDLIRKAREIEVIRAKLIAGELSVQQHGWIDQTPEEMLDGFKEKARRDGRL